MNPFQLLAALPAFLEIRLLGTNQSWANASPQLTMIGSKIWLSYAIGAMTYVLYECAEDAEELERAVAAWSAQLAGCEFFEVEFVFIDGEILRL
ncbi:MAG: hypothetical protein KF852_04255 [Saprospiraceae bacterium]|nr:hypothetical protein [Saprospiraceae bacterium]